jgi:WD40 repeat protein
MQTTRVLAKEALAYRVAVAEPYLVSVELRTEFELVLRQIPGTEGQFKTRRIGIDEATYDINDLVVDASGERAYVASTAGWVRTYDLKSLQVQGEWRTGYAATALALSKDGKYLLIGTDAGVVCLRRLADGAQLQCMVAHTGRIASLDTSKGMLASASWKGEVALWGLPALHKISELEKLDSVADIAFSPDASMLAVARNLRPPLRTRAIDDAEKKSKPSDAVGASRIEIHRLSDSGMSGNPIHILVGHRALVSSLCWIGGDLLSGSWDRSVRLWNTKTGSHTWRQGDFGHIVRDLAARQVQSTFAIAAWAPGRDDPAISWGLLRY